jgi:hypothetical protein
MSGEQLSAVLRYGVDANGAFVLERSFIWPMLRTLPNNTHASLMRRFEWDLLKDMLVLNGRRIGPEKVKSMTLDGVLTVVSEFAYPNNGKLELTRSFFPSPTRAAFCEYYVLRNGGQGPLSIETPESRTILRTESSKGVEGEYIIEAALEGKHGGMCWNTTGW